MAHPVRSGGRVRSPQPRHDRGHEEGPRRQHHHPQPARGGRETSPGTSPGGPSPTATRSPPSISPEPSSPSSSTSAKPQYRLKEFSWIGQISAGQYIFAVGAKTPFKSSEGHAAGQGSPDHGFGSRRYGLGHGELLSGKVMKFNSQASSWATPAPRRPTWPSSRGEGHGRGLGLDSPGQMAFIHDGSMRPMWVYLDKRDPDFPDVPTVGELGYPVAVGACASHRVVTAPPGMPKDRLGHSFKRRSTRPPRTRKCSHGSRR